MICLRCQGIPGGQFPASGREKRFSPRDAWDDQPHFSTLRTSSADHMSDPVAGRFPKRD